MQQSLAEMECLIIDETSMVRSKFLGQSDPRLRQVFPIELTNCLEAAPAYFLETLDSYLH